MWKQFKFRGFLSDGLLILSSQVTFAFVFLWWGLLFLSEEKKRPQKMSQAGSFYWNAYLFIYFNQKMHLSTLSFL